MLKKTLNKITSILLISAVVFSVSACGKKDTASASSSTNNAPVTKVDEIKKAGKLVVGTSADYPPYEFHKKTNGQDEITGFDISIAKEIAKDLGVKLEIKDMKFDGLLAALDSGNVDFVEAGMTPTDERKKKVDFTNVYYQSKQTVVIRKSDEGTYTSADALTGKKLGVQKGAIQEQIAKEQFPKATPKALGKISDLMLELKNNKIEALIVEKPVADAYVSKNPDLLVSSIPVKMDDSGSAIAVKKGNEALVDAMNKTLKRLMDAGDIDKFVSEANEQVDAN